MVKGILKRYSRATATASRSPVPESGSTLAHNVPDDDESPRQKRVSFDGPEPVKVFEADEWDRTPAAVTLKLTYKDVVELRELNISLVKPSPLAMTRTPSRRPTDRRSAVVTRSPNDSPPSSGSSEGDSPSRSPLHGSPSPQHHSFSSQSLGPLLEDVAGLSSSFALPDPDLPVSGSPPGLPVRTPLLKGLGSPILPPPSPLLLSPASSRPPSPKPAPASTPLYRHPWARNRTPLATVADQPPAETPVPIVLPTLTSNTILPEHLKLDKLTLDIDDEEAETDDWKPTGMLGLDMDPASEEADTAAPMPTVVPRKAGRSLMMGWEFKRSPNANGKLGFGLVRNKA